VPPSNDVFVGREHELGQINTALDDVLAGHGRLVMIVGEPGIGKTCTCQELASIAERKHVQVLWGRSYEGEGAPPYWPWIQPIRQYVQQNDVEQVRSELESVAPSFAEIVPRVKHIFPDGCGSFRTTDVAGNVRGEAVAMQTEGADPQYICMRTKHMSARRPPTNETTIVAR